jgi:hypothetical protein
MKNSSPPFPRQVDRGDDAFSRLYWVDQLVHGGKLDNFMLGGRTRRPQYGDMPLLARAIALNATP